MTFTVVTLVCNTEVKNITAPFRYTAGLLTQTPTHGRLVGACFSWRFCSQWFTQSYHLLATAANFAGAHGAHVPPHAVVARSTGGHTLRGGRRLVHSPARSRSSGCAAQRCALRQRRDPRHRRQLPHPRQRPSPSAPRARPGWAAFTAKPASLGYFRRVGQSRVRDAPRGATVSGRVLHPGAVVSAWPGILAPWRAVRSVRRATAVITSRTLVCRFASAARAASSRAHTRPRRARNAPLDASATAARACVA